MNKIEETAKQNNCDTIHVDTYGYQAPDFYKKIGYKKIGKIDNYRSGYERVFFKKELKSLGALASWWFKKIK